MEKLTEQMETYVKEQRLKYMVNESKTRYTLPYRYTAEKGKKYRVEIFVNIDDEKKELEVGFVSEIFDSLDRTQALTELLTLNGKLKQGTVSLVGVDENEIQYFVRTAIEGESFSLANIYDMSVGYCMAVHDYLVRKGIVINE